MTDNSRLGLVLEGGGMRGIYTAGVLDEFLKEGIKFNAVIGVSAGILHAISFVSEQYGRDARYYVKYRNDPRFLSFRSLIRTGNICETEFCYHELPDKLAKFDYERFARNTSFTEVYSVCSNLENGQAEYIRIRDVKKEVDAIRASASLPLVSQIVNYKGMKLLDGGTCDSIPVKALENRGFDRNVVILTRPYGYVKKEDKSLSLMKHVYKNYPDYIEAARTRHIRYNETLRYIDIRKVEGKVLPIYPSRDLNVSRSDKDIDKIKKLYKLGRFDAINMIDKVKEFCNA